LGAWLRDLLLLFLGSCAVLTLGTFALALWVFPGKISQGKGDTPLMRGIELGIAIMKEWVATMWVALAVPFRSAGHRDPPQENQDGGKIPVALIPGYMENAFTLRFLESRLGRELRVPVRAFSPKGYFYGIEVLAVDYGRQIRDWMESLGAKKVHLVGHSLGGLIARVLVEAMDFKDAVDSLVTVGTPHLGSALARMAPGRNARQMRRGSGFLEKINAGAAPASVRFIGISSVSDNLVLPWNGSLSPRGNNFVLRHRGHLSLILSSKVIRIIVREIRGGEEETASLSG
jgi:triacylglycerol lipase